MNRKNARGTANILDFPGNRLTASDHTHALVWIDSAAPLGYGVIRLHRPEPGDAAELGEILAIYRTGEQWAAWGIARSGSTLTLWRSSTGETIGTFRTMLDALAAIPAARRPARGEAERKLESAC